MTSTLHRELGKESWYAIYRMHALEAEVKGAPSKAAVRQARLILQWYFDANSIEYRNPTMW